MSSWQDVVVADLLWDLVWWIWAVHKCSDSHSWLSTAVWHAAVTGVGHAPAAQLRDQGPEEQREILTSGFKILLSLFLWFQFTTRTTRTPAFWGYPLPPHDYLYYWVILDPKSKDDKVKVTNLKKFAKTLHTTHLLGLLDKMCKYEMDPTSIVEDTEQTPYDSVHRLTDGQGETSIHWKGKV